MSKKEAYHHGDLRRALIQAGLELVAKSGAGGFTLREVARRSSVSHNAPYRHFQSRDDLLAAIATEGFQKLSREIDKGASRGATPLEWLIEGCCAYLRFAERSPSYYEVMFAARGSGTASAERTAAAEQAFEMLVGTIRACQASGSLRPDDPRSQARVVWSLLHGIALLHNQGQLAVGRGSIVPFGRQALLKLLRGLQG